MTIEQVEHAITKHTQAEQRYIWLGMEVHAQVAKATIARYTSILAILVMGV